MFDPLRDPRRDHFGMRRYEDCVELHASLVIPQAVKAILKPGMVVKYGYSTYGWCK